MNRKTVYSTIVLLAAAGLFIYEKYSEDDNAAIHPDVTTGSDPKETTNTYFLPTSTTGAEVHHNYYSLSYHETHEQAEWVAYELKKAHLSDADRERPYFNEDPLVKTRSADWRNYKNSGYDRGHLCPAGDRRFSVFAYNQTFLTSNVSPQKHDFNSGVWNRLEQQTRYWAKKHDGVFVVTGGILKKGLKTIGNEKISVPEFFYKVVLDNDHGNFKVIAFLLPHQESSKPLSEFVVTVDEVERLTGIDFFPNLDDEVENRIEAAINLKNWFNK